MTAAGHAEKLALLLVDDHELILLGIRQSLEREGTAGDLVAVRSAAEALQALRSRRFDLCVVDLELPDLPGFELIDAIRRQDPAARIVVNTMHNEIWTVNRLLQSGVQGVVMKDSDAGELARAVRAVAFGGRYFCPRFEQLRRRLLCGSGPDPLTRREQEVLDYILRERRVELYHEKSRFFSTRFYLEPTSPEELAKDAQWSSIQGTNDQKAQLYFDKYGAYPKTQHRICGMRPVEDPDGKISVGGKKYRMERFWKEDRVFLEKHYLFPIPTEELQRANIQQNPNW